MAVASIVDSFETVLNYVDPEATTSEQKLMRLVWSRAEAAVRRYLGTNVVKLTYTHYLPRRRDPFDERAGLNLGKVLRLPEWPVRSLTGAGEGVWLDRNGRAGQVNSAFPASSKLVYGEDYWEWLDDAGLNRWGVIEKAWGEWPGETGSVKVVYQAGWSREELDGNVTDPQLDASDLVLAVLKIAAKQYKNAGGGETESESLGPYTVRYVGVGTQKEANSWIGEEAAALLAPFARMKTMVG